MHDSDCGAVMYDDEDRILASEMHDEPVVQKEMKMHVGDCDGVVVGEEQDLEVLSQIPSLVDRWVPLIPACQSWEWCLPSLEWEEQHLGGVECLQRLYYHAPLLHHHCYLMCYHCHSGSVPGFIDHFVVWELCWEGGPPGRHGKT